MSQNIKNARKDLVVNLKRYQSDIKVIRDIESGYIDMVYSDAFKHANLDRIKQILIKEYVAYMDSIGDKITAIEALQGE